MDQLARPAMLACADGEWSRGRFVQLDRLVIAEHLGDFAQAKPHHFVAYQMSDAEPDSLGVLDSASMLFVLGEERPKTGACSASLTPTTGTLR